MNIIKSCILLIPHAISQFIEIRWERRPVYISNWISTEHREGIQNAMDQLGLQETQNKSINHIRIEYSGGVNGGGIEMLASTDYDGFYIYKTVIGINRLLDRNSFQCIALHELLHAYGLAHNENSRVMKPIINYTQNYCYLNIVDIINLYNIGFYDP